MKKNLSMLVRALCFALFVCFFTSCKKNNVEKINIDNQFAISLFCDTVKVSELLNNMDSLTSNFIKVKEDGSIYAYYNDSMRNVVKAEDILGMLDDVTFETQNEFELPTIPPSPVPVPVELPLDDIFSIPFEYEGYEINSVVLKSGTIDMTLSSNFTMIDELTLSTDNIILANGESFEVSVVLGENGTQNIEIDLTNCTVSPEDKNITFSAMLKATISTEGMGGLYNFDLEGGIYNLKLKSVDGSIADTRFDFDGTHDFAINFPNLYGDLKIATPELTVGYVNTFGFEADGSVDSLYLTDGNGEKISLIKDWNDMELELHPTGDSYGYINNIDEQLVDEIDLLHDYRCATFRGNVVLGCDNVSENMITDESHIDIVFDLALPLELNINQLNFIDTLDFNLNLNSDTENADENIHIEDLFDELEFKFVFKNELPLQITPQLYMLENGVVIDSLFADGSYIHGNFDGVMVEDVLVVKVQDESLYNIQRANQLLLNIGLSSHGQNVVINANDYFNLRIGLKTKTTEIYIDDLDF